MRDYSPEYKVTPLPSLLKKRIQHGNKWSTSSTSALSGRTQKIRSINGTRFTWAGGSWELTWIVTAFNAPRILNLHAGWNESTKSHGGKPETTVRSELRQVSVLFLLWLYKFDCRCRRGFLTLRWITCRRDRREDVSDRFEPKQDEDEVHVSVKWNCRYDIVQHKKDETSSFHTGCQTTPLGYSGPTCWFSETLV